MDAQNISNQLSSSSLPSFYCYSSSSIDPNQTDKVVLAEEKICDIFSHFSVVDLRVRTISVCKQWNEISKEYLQKAENQEYQKIRKSIKILIERFDFETLKMQQQLIFNNRARSKTAQLLETLLNKNCDKIKSSALKQQVIEILGQAYEIDSSCKDYHFEDKLAENLMSLSPHVRTCISYINEEYRHPWTIDKTRTLLDNYKDIHKACLLLLEESIFGMASKLAWKIRNNDRYLGKQMEQLQEDVKKLQEDAYAKIAKALTKQGYFRSAFEIVNKNVRPYSVAMLQYKYYVLDSISDGFKEFNYNSDGFKELNYNVADDMITYFRSKFTKSQYISNQPNSSIQPNLTDPVVFSEEKIRTIFSHLNAVDLRVRTISVCKQWNKISKEYLAKAKNQDYQETRKSVTILMDRINFEKARFLIPEKIERLTFEKQKQFILENGYSSIASKLLKELLDKNCDETKSSSALKKQAIEVLEKAYDMENSFIEDYCFQNKLAENLKKLSKNVILYKSKRRTHCTTSNYQHLPDYCREACNTCMLLLENSIFDMASKFALEINIDDHYSDECFRQRAKEFQEHTFALIAKALTKQGYFGNAFEIANRDLYPHSVLENLRCKFYVLGFISDGFKELNYNIPENMVDYFVSRGNGKLTS